MVEIEIGKRYKFQIEHMLDLLDIVGYCNDCIVFYLSSDINSRYNYEDGEYIVGTVIDISKHDESIYLTLENVEVYNEFD